MIEGWQIFYKKTAHYLPGKSPKWGEPPYIEPAG